MKNENILTNFSVPFKSIGQAPSGHSYEKIREEINQYVPNFNRSRSGTKKLVL